MIWSQKIITMLPNYKPANCDNLIPTLSMIAALCPGPLRKMCKQTRKSGNVPPAAGHFPRSLWISYDTDTFSSVCCDSNGGPLKQAAQTKLCVFESWK